MREITLVLPYFMNAGMLAEQQRVWADYPSSVRAHLHVVVVDDCSPKGPHRLVRDVASELVTVHDLASFRIYRLQLKRKWNWLACRNLGATVATTDWLILTDIDHVFPVETMTYLMTAPLDPSRAYKFGRVNATSCWPYAVPVPELPWHKPHNDTWVMTRSLFFHERVGGYDERLSGHYGTSGEFTDRVVAATSAIVSLRELIIRYPREVIPDASTSPSVYTRKNDPRNDASLAKAKRGRANLGTWKPLHGLVPSELVYDSTAVAVPA